MGQAGLCSPESASAQGPGSFAFHLCQFAAPVVETVNSEHKLELFYLLHRPLDNQIQVIILILKFVILCLVYLPVSVL